MTEMSRDEFVQALAQALAANEAEQRVPKSAHDVAMDAYDAMQFDFPMMSATDLRVLAERMHGRDRSQFPVTRPLFLNALELAAKADAAISAAAACVLVQCFCIPFQDPSGLDAFRFESLASEDAKLLYMCYHTTYSPLSALTHDDWNYYQVTDACCSIAASLLHRPRTSDESLLLQMEWLRYLYILRDRMLQHPQTCPAILQRLATLFSTPEHVAKMEEVSSLSFLRLLLELTSSKDISASVVASSAILSILKPLVPMIERHITFDGAAMDDRADSIIVISQLLLWSVQKQPTTWVPLLFDAGILRACLRVVATDPEGKAMKAALRVLVLCGLVNASFGSYVHAVPSMVKWSADDRFQTLYPAEHVLWTLSQLLSGSTNDAMRFFELLPGLFPSMCDSFLDAQCALHDAVFALETLATLVQSHTQPRYASWHAKDNLAPVLARLIPEINLRFAYPVRHDKVEDGPEGDSAGGSSNARVQLMNRLRQAIKRAMTGNAIRASAKLD
ncbi:hypothetical protein SPRG_09129 [Saprolegnia parasitica CBS 223.65]|uniref:Uncharacterized protein n=1 Tax=Saprolegnia parasitica (strain CBS 223.65) TaxID=695850 RepID=A0A067C3F7_SAPPC|nr:hypothetical protein SPRG_09129 [Saprolegnia parasitica CBS 223.65]KDO25299.1 hypothetical protein SPRG_09129 [Saprolegnia parasitica CBS 223.65]|eukprot:XP_012203957.1 hypothetical protein SPRG_09129 [Saprolegnia parasitica CBS 223.65]